MPSADSVREPALKPAPALNSLPAVPSRPYAFPFDGAWSAKDTALLIIDMQTDFCLPGGYCDQMGIDISMTGAVIEPINRVLAAMRTAGFPIIHTREGHRADLSDLNENKRWRSARAGAQIGSEGPYGRILTRGEPGWEIVPALRPLADEPVIDKPGKGAFYATDLALILARLNIRNLIIAGVTTDCCVHTTMRDANDRGFECVLLEDCCAASEQANHDAILRLTVQGHGLFGLVTHSSHLLAALSSAQIR